MPRHSSNPPNLRAAQEPPEATHCVGEPILHSGVYQVRHAGHRISHYVVLLSGQVFPRCARCGDQVRFALFQATTDLKSDPDFQVRLYEIPHPSPADGDEEREETNEVA